MRIKQVAKEGALAALAASKPGVAARQRDYELEAAKAEIARLSEALQGAGGQADAGGGKRRLGLSGRVPHRVDAATKAGLLDLIDQAVDAGWTIRRACGVLELGEVRAHRWYARRARGQLADKAPGGSPMHGILPEEAERSWPCSMSGARSTGPTESWRTGAPTWAGCGSRLRRCAGCFSLQTSTFGRFRGRASRSGGRSRSGWSTPRTRSGSTTRRTSPGRGWRC